MTPKKASHFTKSQVIATLSVGYGSTLIGYNLAWSSPAISSLQNPDGRVQVTDYEASWIASLIPLAALAGGIFAGFLLESIGRKMTILITGVPLICSGLLVAFASNLEMIYAGRGLAGFFVGVMSPCIAIYVCEVTHPEIRGTLAMLPGTQLNLGVIFAYSLGLRCDWSMLALIGAILPVPFLIAMALVPDTPRFLLMKGKPEEAERTLKWLRRSGERISEELQEIETAAQQSLKSETKLKDLFQQSYLKRVAISLGLMFFQQFSGINAVVMYSVTIFENSGSSIEPSTASIILSLVMCVATIGCNILIDKVGRKLLLGASSIGCFLSLLGLATYFFSREKLNMTDVPGWVPIFSLIIFVMSFSVGLGPIPWIFMAEIFPGKIRGVASSFVTSFNWGCGFIVAKTFVDIQILLGYWGVLYLFAAFTICSLLFIILLVPETRGLTLEQIEQLYNMEDSSLEVEMAPLKSLPTLG